MRKILKWIGFVIGGLVVLILVAAGVVYILSEAHFNKTYEVKVGAVPIPTDPESIAYGEHIARIRGCKGCHGEDLSGQIEIESPMIGVIANANLTGGEGSEVINYSDEDWVRSIRHGVGPDGKPLIIMPSQLHNVMSDEDLGAMLAYIKSLPPVDNQLPELKISLVMRAIYLSGKLDMVVPAELIDHNAPRPISPARGATAEYGKYLTGLCTLCHGEGFSGGPLPVPEPGAPPPLNLTRGGELIGWTSEDFKTALRTGVTPSGHQLNDEYMPWKTLFQYMTDEELESIWLYLQSLPPMEYGNH